ncbi:hypothetical protein MAR_018829 [Mya arenaria]|uniref:Uncharacterized protein n=1 Tax=Mya arenaria TaxID=6604 RepID=A0ABY7EJ92_MYAAR|nr:hypothetical protein MAR_018829 [Mya arenaria]
MVMSLQRIPGIPVN